MMHLKRHGSIVIWLAVVALIAQTWMAPLALSAAADQAGGLVICTGTGFKLIPFPRNDEEAPVDAPADRSLGVACVACLHGALGQAGAASAAFLPQPVEHAAIGFHLVHQRPPLMPGFGVARSRSPPRLVPFPERPTCAASPSRAQPWLFRAS